MFTKEFNLYDGEPLPELNFEKVLKEQEAHIKSKKEYNQKLLDEWCERWHLGKQFSYAFYYTYVDGLHSLDDRYKDKQQMLMELNMIDPYPEFTLYQNNWGNTWSGFESANTVKEREIQRQKTTKAVNDILLSLDLNLQEKKNELWNPGGNKINFATMTDKNTEPPKPSHWQDELFTIPECITPDYIRKAIYHIWPK